MADIEIIVEESPSIIITSPNGVTSLDQLSDVQASNPSDGQALIYQSGRWRAISFSATDAHQVYTPPSASDTWAITHNMNKFPSVTVVDSAGDEVEGNVNHISVNQLVITFSAAFSGRAYLN